MKSLVLLISNEFLILTFMITKISTIGTWNDENQKNILKKTL